MEMTLERGEVVVKRTDPRGCGVESWWWMERRGCPESLRSSEVPEQEQVVRTAGSRNAGYYGVAALYGG